VNRQAELVLAPREAVNDDSAILTEWVRPDGSRVEGGDVVCRLEYSKAVIDVPAPCAGWIFHLRRVGEDVAVGSPVGTVSATPERPVATPASSASELGLKITAKALVLIQSHGIDPAVFRDVEFVKEAHVRAHLESIGAHGVSARAPSGALRAHSPNRRRTAAVLSKSAQEVPHSYLTRWVSAESLEKHVERVATERQIALSVSDLLLWAVARQCKLRSFANAAWQDEGMLLYDRVNVGFALNQSSGDLFVPVVHDADGMAIEDLVARIRALQVRAVRQKLTPADLAGGTVTITSLIGTGAHSVLPILVPGQAVIVAIGDRCATFGAPAYGLTIGFDHRVMNGAEAAEFLSELAQLLERENDE
jgi:pyruvate/2-oxoglutarate dehydrogenase complex dihydrolipoamide acyltransferase (E2) component